MTDHPNNTQMDDHKQVVGGSGAITTVHIVGLSWPIVAVLLIITSLAFAISVLCAFYAFEAGREQAQTIYWLQRNEAFLEQLSFQGIKIPCDLTPNRKDCR